MVSTGYVPKKACRELLLQQAIASLDLAKPHPSKDPGLYQGVSRGPPQKVLCPGMLKDVALEAGCFCNSECNTVLSVSEQNNKKIK